MGVLTARCKANLSAFHYTHTHTHTHTIMSTGDIQPNTNPNLTLYNPGAREQPYMTYEFQSTPY